MVEPRHGNSNFTGKMSKKKNRFLSKEGIFRKHKDYRLVPLGRGIRVLMLSVDDLKNLGFYSCTSISIRKVL